MSKDTGCFVLVQVDGEQIKVLGSLEREQSLSLARDILNWKPEIEEDVKKAVTLSLVN